MEAAVERVRLLFSVNSIADVAVANNILYLAIEPRTIVRIDLDDPTRVEDVQLPAKQTEGNLRRLFAHPSGAHLLAITTVNEHYYLAKDSTKARALARLKGIATTAVGWSPLPEARNPGPILLGTNRGSIHELLLEGGANETYFKRDIKQLKTVWTSKQGAPVSGISVLKESIIVLCGAELFLWSEKLSLTSNPLASSPAHTVDFPATPAASRRPSRLSVAPDGSHLVVERGGNVFTISIQSSLDSDIEPVPIPLDSSVLFTLVAKYHLVAFTESEQIFVNLFDNSVTLTIPFMTINERIIGAGSDPVRHTHWLWSSDDLLELRVTNEEAAIWPVLVSQKRFDLALEVSTGNRSARQKVLQSYGNHLVSSDPVKAAKLLGLSDASFETAALNFLDNTDALIEMFTARLAHTKSPVQQVILTSWLVELYVSHAHERPEYDDAYRRLLDKYGDVINHETVEEILEENGDVPKLLEFWTASQKIGKVVAYYVAHQDWSKALELLRIHEDVESVYRYASILLARSPQATVESWMRIASLDPKKLLPALSEYAVSYRGDPSRNQSARYLRHLLANKSLASIEIYNALVMVYAVNPETDETELLKLLHDKGSDYSDQDFALRVCLQHGKLKSAIYLYTIMDLREEAVAVCIENGLLDEGIEIAGEISGNDSLKRYLFQEIARKIISSSPDGAQKALKLVGELRVDDLLSLFPDFQTLDELAPEIVKSLESAKNQLASINGEMDESLSASRAMQAEILNFKKQSVLVEVGESCRLCDFPLATRRFYVFPCQHGFHADCLSKVVSAAGAGDEDEKLARECYACSEARITEIDSPLIDDF